MFTKKLKVKCTIYKYNITHDVPTLILIFINIYDLGI